MCERVKVNAERQSLVRHTQFSHMQNIFAPINRMQSFEIPNAYTHTHTPCTSMAKQLYETTSLFETNSIHNPMVQK